MNIIELRDGLDLCVRESSSVLSKGGVLVYPTDTLYGLGADAFSDEAVDKIIAIKGREAGKPISCIVRDLDMAEEYAEVSEIARELARKFLPGPLTLVLRKKQGVTTGIGRGQETLGIRIPNHEYCLKLAQAFGRSYTTTSANLAGMPTQDFPENILKQFGEKARFIDLVMSAGTLAAHPPSTIVSIVNGSPRILREGVISATQLGL